MISKIKSYGKIGNRSHLLAVFLLFFFCCFNIGCQESEIDEDNTEKLIQEGLSLSEKEAEQLEAYLKNKPEDLSVRIKLLGYYFMKGYTSEKSQKARQRHIFWIIKHKSESEIAGLPYIMINPRKYPEAYKEASELWQKQVEIYRDKPSVLGNAASFFILNNDELSEKLLKRAKQLEPQNPEWPKLLGQLYQKRKVRKQEGEKKKTAFEAMREIEESLKLKKNDKEKFYLLSDLAKNAFDAGEIKKAEKYAIDLLNLAQKYKNNWNYGNAIHHAYTIHGRISLISGDIAEAKEYLIKSAQTTGSPQLKSFGPNMSLAKDLLEKGECNIVLKYFELCENFWKSGKNKLMKWEKTVKEGKIPDFRANLSY